MHKKQKKFFIQEHLQKTVFHGGVGNIDIERILLDNGYEAIVFPFHFEFSVKAKCFRYLYLLKQLFSLPADAIVFFQFPLYARMHHLLLRLLRFRPSIRIICLVADINGLKDGDEAILKEEIRVLSGFRYFIVHGKPMESWLKSNIPHALISLLYFFDFLAKPVNDDRNKSSEIAFAGNLAKSPFLNDLHLVTSGNNALHFHIYGAGGKDDAAQQPGVILKGVYPPYELPAFIKESFGLLWDGESIDGPGGSIGDYMEYISHHKLSLYIIAGVPIIAYERAGSASLINELNIGITVQSIRDIPGKLSLLSDEAYQLMRKNMKPIADRISKGDYLMSAISSLEEKIRMEKNN